jgi:hypothetical protein
LPEAVRVEIKGVNLPPEWLEQAVAKVLEGKLNENVETGHLQRFVWSALNGSSGHLVVALGSENGYRAVRLSSEECRWGSADVSPGSLLVQVSSISQTDFQAHQDLLFGLCCSASTRIVGPGELASAFGPCSFPFAEPELREDPLLVGVWAFPPESDSVPSIPLGDFFSQVDETGIERNELTFGTFRRGFLGDPASLFRKSKAATVVSFSHHWAPTTSRVVWLQNGVKLAYHNFTWEPQSLAVTVYLELSSDLMWDDRGVSFEWETDWNARLEEAKTAVDQALRKTVEEYNLYTPAITGVTVLLWALIVLVCLGLAGLMAPFTGSGIAGLMGSVIAVFLIKAEFQNRYRERLAIGNGLKALAELLDLEKDWWEPEPRFSYGDDLSPS